MRNSRKPDVAAKLTKEWRLPATATLGSSVRTKGIFLEVRAHLPSETKKLLHVETGMLTLRLLEGSEQGFQSACGIVSNMLEGIEDLPVIPREVEDILSITATERHRWLRDGRLQAPARAP